MVAQPSAADIAALKTRVAAVSEPSSSEALAFGVTAVDARLTAGGVAPGGLHEVAVAQPALGDDAAATLFLAGIAARFSRASDASVLWVLSCFDLQTGSA